jgi:hypothetical protein
VRRGEGGQMKMFAIAAAAFAALNGFGNCRQPVFVAA